MSLWKKAHKTKKGAEEVALEVREKAAGYLLAGFGVVAGLAWNEAVKELIEVLWPMDQESLIAKFVYACAMTLLVVIASMVLLKFTKKKKEIDAKKK